MQTEFEVKILDIDVEAIVSKLDSIGAKKADEKFFKRYVYDFTPPRNDSWIRLRTDGNRAELTIKEIKDDSIEGTKETEIEVSDFETAHEILKKLGYERRSYQENKRISYRLEGVEIEVDQWPKIPPYVEIEGKNKEVVEETVRKLGFSMDDTTSINTMKVYDSYGINIRNNKELKFEDED